MAAAVICVISVVTIFIFLIVKSAPALKKIGFFDFLFGTEWSPDKDATYDKQLTGSYGVAKMIAGTLAATLGAIITGGITGYFTAVFLAFYCPKRIKKFLCAAINLLAGIPSVVYGFFGISFVLPLLSIIAPNGGDGLMATSIILGIMILPTVVSLSRTALEAVPKSYYEGSVSLGANHNRTVFSVMSPAAKSGIFASLILGIGRALGETMAVVMVAGNSVAYPKDLFTSFRVLTANIVLEMGYAGEVQTGALIASGVVLLVFVLITNLAFGLISGKIVVKAVNKGTSVQSADGKISKSAGITLSQRIKNFFAPIGSFCGKAAYKLHLSDVKAALAIICGVLSASSLVLVIGFIMVKGVPELIKDPAILYRKYEFGNNNHSRNGGAQPADFGPDRNNDRDISKRVRKTRQRVRKNNTFRHRRACGRSLHRVRTVRHDRVCAGVRRQRQPYRGYAYDKHDAASRNSPLHRGKSENRTRFSA